MSYLPKVGDYIYFDQDELCSGGHIVGVIKHTNDVVVLTENGHGWDCDGLVGYDYADYDPAHVDSDTDGSYWFVELENILRHPTQKKRKVL